VSTFKHGDFLRDVSADNSNHRLLQFVRCPVCYDNLRDKSLHDIEQHLADHDPEELGLTERPTPGRSMAVSRYGIGRDEILDAMGCRTHDINYTPTVVEQKELVEHIADADGTVTHADGADALGVSRRVAQREGKELHRAGWLWRVASGTPHRYSLIGRGATELDGEQVTAAVCGDHREYDPTVVQHRGLVEHIAENGGVVTYADAAEALDLSESAARRHVKELHRAGWLQRIENGYRGRLRYQLLGTEGGDR
jgi:predicted ArsR family transcriptional regulator